MIIVARLKWIEARDGKHFFLFIARMKVDNLVICGNSEIFFLHHDYHNIKIKQIFGRLPNIFGLFTMDAIWSKQTHHTHTESNNYFTRCWCSSFRVKWFRCMKIDKKQNSKLRRNGRNRKPFIVITSFFYFRFDHEREENKKKKNGEINNIRWLDVTKHKNCIIIRPNFWRLSLCICQLKTFSFD